MLNRRRLTARVLVMAALALISLSSFAAASKSRHPVELTYLGNAGWQITDGKTVILVDPYISEFRNGGNKTQITTDDPIAEPDKAGIDARIHKADYILITHGHDDHMLDAPYISRKTGAVIICTESAANIARAHGVGDTFTARNFNPALVKKQPLIVVRGGEDFQFDGFSLEVIPSLHTALWNKRYNDGFWADKTPAGLKAPLHESDYADGGTLIYLLRIAGHQIFIMGSMNYIEREITGLRPDIAIVGAGRDRNQIYDYAGRLMRDLGNPPIVFPTHWDDYGFKPRAEVLKEVGVFTNEIHAASPRTKVIVPNYFVPIKVN